MTLRQFSQKIVDFYPLMMREFARRSGGEFACGSMTVPQMIALHYMEGRPRASMKEMADVMRVRMSSSTVMVDRLIEQGLVRRLRDQKDRRVVWVIITPKGKRRLEVSRKARLRLIEDLFGRLSRFDRDQYLRILSKVQTHLQESHGTP